MKPYEVMGVELNTSQEAYTAGIALVRTADMLAHGHPWKNVLAGMSQQALNRVVTCGQAEGSQLEEPFRLVFPDRMGAGMIAIQAIYAAANGILGADIQPHAAAMAEDYQTRYLETIFRVLD